jgi:predicted nucleic acid-binding protein
VTVQAPFTPAATETAFVIDASIAARWIFDDEALAGDDLLDVLLSDGAMAPALWLLEVANMTRSGERRGRLTETEARARLENIARLPIEFEPMTVGRAFETIPRLAREHGLTAYDAAYLELALRTRRRLATLDQPLRTAAASLGIPLLPTT